MTSKVFALFNYVQLLTCFTNSVVLKGEGSKGQTNEDDLAFGNF